MALDLQLFLVKLLAQTGLPYVYPDQSNNYSGKGLPGSLYPKGRDCSGVVTVAIHEAGGPDLRANTNAKKLLDMCQEFKNPNPGDLCFYGAGRNMVQHVMTYLDGTVFGACGGNSHTTTPELAAKIGGIVRFRKSHLYRPDFICFGRLKL